MIDLRLALPAGAAWGGAAVAISMPSAWWLAVVLWAAAVAAAVVALVVGSRGEHTPRARLPVVLAAACVAAATAALVATAASAATPLRRPDEVRALAHHTVVLRATVASAAVASSTASGFGAAQRTRFSATVTAVTAGTTTVRARMPVLVFAPKGTRVQIGATVRVTGNVAVLEPSSEIAAFVYASGRPRAIDSAPAPLAAANAMRSGFSRVAADLPGDGGALLPGLAIGDVHQVPDSLTQAMKSSSLTHLTAVSGANCAVVVSLIGAGAGAVGLGRAGRSMASLGALAAFVVLVTPQPSVLRAAAMAAVVVFAGWSGRQGRAVSALSFAVVALLVTDPWLAVDYGFALSVLATGALLLLAPPLTRRLSAYLPARVATVIAVPLAAQVACQPVLIMLNPTVPLYGVLANLVAEPAAPLATVIGLGACLLVPVWPAAGALVAHVAWLPSAWIAAVARVSAALPASALEWAGGVLGFVLMLVVAVAVVLLVIRPRGRVARRARWAALAASGVIVVCTLAGSMGAGVAQALSRPANWSIAACDIGQGDAVLLRSGDAHALVDTGPDPARLTDCLDALGIGRIDLLVLTHYDMDHVGGTSAIVGKVGLALVGPATDAHAREVDDELRYGGADVRVAQTGDAGTFGDVAWRVLWPDADGDGMEDGNEKSVTMLFDGDGIRSLFLGDLDERAQSALLATGRVPQVQVVKVAHHGSSDQAEALYDALSAAVGLISSGIGNDYGHPTQTALGILHRAGILAMRTDVQGMLMVASDGHGGLRTWTQRHASAEILRTPGRELSVGGGG